jgi:hypothetical protein
VKAFRPWVQELSFILLGLATMFFACDYNRLYSNLTMYFGGAFLRVQLDTQPLQGGEIRRHSSEYFQW